MPDTDTTDPLADVRAGLARLREPFPPDQIGKLPKGNTFLDYVGHADLTARLLDVDPFWTWEPFALDQHGLPAIVGGNLWIRLTVCGVTRIGVGDGKSDKERIGDALRNAAMRFGAALDLWAKGERDYGRQEHAAAAMRPEYVVKTLDLIGTMDEADRSRLREFVDAQGFPPQPDAWDEETCTAIRHRAHQIAKR